MRRVLIAAFWVASGSLAAGAGDPREIVRRAVQFASHNEPIARNYTFLQREELRTLNDTGATSKQNIQTWDITTLEGSGYRRLVARNDKPLPPQEEKQEQARLAASIDERRKETPEQRRHRIAEWEQRRRERREYFQEVPDAFDFKFAGEETLDGVDVWVIDGLPHPGYRPKSRFAAYLPKIKGRVWIAKSDFGMVKVDVETLDTISIGAFLVRVAKGSHLVMSQTHVNDEIWMPKRISLFAGARVLLVKGYRFDAEYSFMEYKKFQTDSRVVANK